MELLSQPRFYFRAIKRSWWIILLATFSAAAGTLYMLIDEIYLYQAKATFIISPTELGDTRDIYGQVTTMEEVRATYAEVFQSQSIKLEAAAKLSLESSLPAQYDASAVVLPDTNIIELSVTGPDPVTTANLTNMIGQSGIDYLAGLYRFYDVHLLDAAPIPTKPFSPQPLRDTLLAAIVGMAAGMVLAFIRELIVQS